MKRVKQIYSDQFTKSIKNTREKSGSMKNENVFIKSERFLNARERDIDFMKIRFKG